MIVLVGMVIGLVLGLTGAGGSIFAMPLLTLLLGLSVHDAVGLALGSVAVSSLVGALRCWHGGGILWLPVTILGAAGAVSAPIGNMLGSKTSPSILAAGFTVLAFVVAIRMWQQAKAAPEQSHILRASPIASPGFIAPTCRLSQTGQFELKPRCVSALLFGGVVVGLVGGFFVVGGGFLFTMCSGTDSYDIALSAHGVDICEEMYDGDGADPQAQQKLDFKQTLAFENFKLSRNPLEYEYSDIDGTKLHRKLQEHQDKFTLFDFSAKWDIVPTMLTQNHTNIIDGFMGQTTSFKKDLIKPDVLILGEHKSINTARYIHGGLGKGTWTFYGGHDPEDYTHYVGDPPTDLSLHPNSPGYRLILNNILFPAAKKKKRKT